MKSIILATKNIGKIKELKEIIADYHISSLTDMGIDADIEENGATFEENALIKARAVHSKTGLSVIADDSGLEVYALNMMPGIFSARYAGEGASDAERIEKLLHELKDVPQEKRQARFVCAAAMINKNGEEIVCHGETYGHIAFKRSGGNGFGYDSVFISDETGKTFGEMDNNEKNLISHRRRAFEQLKAYM